MSAFRIIWRLYYSTAGCQLAWHWAVPLFLAEGSFAGSPRKCAWSGCSSAIDTLSYNYLISFDKLRINHLSPIYGESIEPSAIYSEHVALGSAASLVEEPSTLPLRYLAER